MGGEKFASLSLATQCPAKLELELELARCLSGQGRFGTDGHGSKLGEGSFFAMSIQNSSEESILSAISDEGSCIVIIGVFSLNPVFKFPVVL
jgi:hypothetical protein